jgi:peptidoglycan hydrolase-like protein with peptidoglycan-binding domain
MARSLKHGSNVFIVIDGRWSNISLGMTAEQQAELGHKFGCAELANFDGGGSSQIMIGDKIINRPSDGRERSIISAIVAYRMYTLAELPVLKKGKTGVYVNLLQRLLGISADGIFGSGTLAAVRVYQKQHKLSIDGIVGKQTWAKFTERIMS